ncbi:MAG: phospholipid carrier-dependent glycosyltransferase [Bdellovibrionota bacterium]
MWFYLILTLALGLKLFRLGEPKAYVFDEVYHGFTAQELVKGNVSTYDPWAKPPEGMAYEWTHPPLGKILMSAAIKLTGDGFFGMRLSSAIFGTLVIALTFLIGIELLGSTRAALISIFLLSIEGLAFVQSRVAMIDSHFLAFGLLGLLFYIKWRKDRERKLFLSLAALALGLALATKWSAIYLFGLLGADIVLLWFNAPRRPKVRTVLSWWLVLFGIPPIIYLISYSQFFSFGYNWAQFVELQRQMWWYHTNLDKTHSYQSVPWQWVLNLRPVWMYVNRPSESQTANIYNLGNPVIFYFGLYAIYRLAKDFRATWKWEYGFMLGAYFILWLPWVFSPRIMFLYHYLPAVPWLCLASGWVLEKWSLDAELSRRKKFRVTIGLAALWFAVFYPHLTALPVPVKFADSVYFFLSSWR